MSSYTEFLGLEAYFARSGPEVRPAVDSFRNVLGVMHNPHYLEVLASTKPA